MRSTASNVRPEIIASQTDVKGSLMLLLLLYLITSQSLGLMQYFVAITA